MYVNIWIISSSQGTKKKLNTSVPVCLADIIDTMRYVFKAPFWGVIAWNLFDPSFMSNGRSMMVWTMRPRQDGRLSKEDNFKCIFSTENAAISINISLKFVPMGPINNILALVPILAWRRPTNDG